jgi:hypothetical protein
VIAEHRYVMAHLLGRPLTSKEIVHHKDENKRNNEPSNLEIVLKKDHAKLHAKGRTMTDIICSGCGCIYKRELRNHSCKVKSGQKNFYCSRSCASFWKLKKYLREDSSFGHIMGG